MKLTLLDSCADDLAVVNAARVSFAQSHDWIWDFPEGSTESVPVLPEGDDKLLAFLLKNRHGTPFEHGYFRFHVEAPIFVFREWHRHRIGHSYNEMSARYVEMEKRFYEPESFRTQHGKPGAYTFEESGPNPFYSEAMEGAYNSAWNTYQFLLQRGVAKEQARAVLPVGIYTQMYWSCNPRSLMHFLGLRNAKTAMKEIRDLAAAAEKEFVRIMPVTAQAFIDNGRVAP